ncbi:hypothetical protein [Streptomyces sp. NRRL F-5123]|uniref:hypothetical protein n=1 Tax=Streptomyces sp. NRRL F-5123 TaxID=1463856 RepID=UPI0004E1DF01|nr:hypothetical protein [Streptomyces sp. NRRL F-5123]
MNDKKTQARETRDRITRRLKDEGWTREAAAEKFNWPDFEFTNDNAKLEFFYSAADDWVHLGMLTDDLEGYLRIHFGNDVGPLLDAVVSSQSRLSPDHWDAFIETLLAIPLRVYAVHGEDEEDVVELKRRASGSS